MANTDNSYHSIEFPFSSLKDFRRACIEGTCDVATDLPTVRKFLHDRPNQEKQTLSLSVIAVRYAHVVICAAIAAYAAVSARPLALSAIPLLVLLRIAFSPKARTPNKYQRLVIIATLFAGFVLSACLLDIQRVVIASALIIAWLVQRQESQANLTMFFKRLFNDESFCRSAWTRGAFIIRYSDQISRPSSVNNELPYGPSVTEVSASLADDQKIEFSLEFPSTPPKDNDDTPDLDPAFISDIDARAMRIVLQYERRQRRIPEDVSMYFVGFDVRSRDTTGEEQRAIEVKGKFTEGNVEITLNEWKTAAKLGDRYFLYVVEMLSSNSPRITIIRNPYNKLRPTVKKVQYILSRSVFATEANLVDQCVSRYRFGK